MRRWSLLSASAAVLLLASGVNGVDAAKKLKLGTVANPGIPLGAAIAEGLVPVTEKASGGELMIEPHYRGSLCGEQICGEQSAQGLIAIASSSTANFGNFGATYASFDLPYLFKDLDTAKTLAKGWFGQAHHDRAVKETGFHVFSVFNAGGFRQVSNTKHTIKAPKDLKGIKIRVTKSPVEFTLIKSWGGVPIPYDWLQLYQGLQTGVVEGMYVQVAWQNLFKMYEVQPYFTFTNGAWGGNVLYMHDINMKKLNDAEKAALGKGMDAFDTLARDKNLAWIEAGVKEMATKKGVEYYDPTPAEQDLWRAGAVVAWVDAKGTYDSKIVEKALTEQGLTTFLGTLKKAGAL